MGLVEYPDSSTDSEPEGLLPPKKKQRSSSDAVKQTLPALPTAFHDLYASSIRVSVRDDPNLHGGRKRVIPHVEGNWPTHIYLEWYPRRDELTVLKDVLSKFLTTDQKQPFIEAFERAIKSSNTQRFTVVPDTLDWVSNTERTRWFLVLKLKKPTGDNLNRLLQISNRLLGAYNQPPLYATKPQSQLLFNLKTTQDTISYSWPVSFNKMASLQIPSVTLEDLQKFQANHFFEATTTPASAAQPGLVENEEESYYEEEDLGYYKDGAKRTLTDEQIEIFRHSEIHALLRERERLREEAEEQSDLEETNEFGKMSKAGADFQNEVDSSALKRKSVEGSEDSSAKRAKEEEVTARQSDGDAAAASTQQTQQTPSSRDFNFGRKIVSYAED
ncbi:hypothetical protein ZTR_10767 [Talaromyces verruculosus]|nr:hypothetical protein ZTR_10767 [Talaromyces verruculosus]